MRRFAQSKEGDTVALGRAILNCERLGGRLQLETGYRRAGLTPVCSDDLSSRGTRENQGWRQRHEVSSSNHHDDRGPLLIQFGSEERERPLCRAPPNRVVVARAFSEQGCRLRLAAN